jgi:hypothetical protein
MGWMKRPKRRARAPVRALTKQGESPCQADVSPACDRRLLRRGDTRWGAAGGELPVRNDVNSIRPVKGTSLRALCEVRPVAHASWEVLRVQRAGQQDRIRVRKEPVNKRKAAELLAGGWRQNGRKRERGKQGDLPGTERCSWPKCPKSRPAGVRASVVAMKRVTSVEPRDAGKWKRESYDQ